MPDLRSDSGPALFIHRFIGLFFFATAEHPLYIFQLSIPVVRILDIAFVQERNMLLNPDLHSRQCLNSYPPGFFETMLTVDTNIAPACPVMFRNSRHKVPVIRCYFCNHNRTGKVRNFYVTAFFFSKGTPHIYRHFHSWLRISLHSFQHVSNVKTEHAVAVNLITKFRQCGRFLSLGGEHPGVFKFHFLFHLDPSGVCMVRRFKSRHPKKFVKSKKGVASLF